MMYSKGDTIKLIRGSIVLILDNGTKGVEFCRTHKKKRVNLYSQVIGRIIEYVIRESNSHSQNTVPAREHVYYSILIGDVKGWVTEMTLEKWERHDAV